jgi:hypothetical protein
VGLQHKQRHRTSFSGDRLNLIDVVKISKTANTIPTVRVFAQKLVILPPLER